MRDHADAKAMAKTMRQALSEKAVEITHGQALEIVARQFGFASWNVLSARIDAGESGREPFSFEQAIPIVRVFDVAKAREFYLGFLGFKIDWEHRFGENFPLYMPVSRNGLKLHLSEHAGDASPGCNMIVPTHGLRALHKSLEEQAYRYLRPSLEQQDWGLEMEVVDPFNNRIRFLERSEAR